MSKKKKKFRKVGPISPKPLSPVSPAPVRIGVFNPDYSMVKKDLKNIGMLAGFFFVVLFVLSFILK